MCHLIFRMRSSRFLDYLQSIQTTKEVRAKKKPVHSSCHKAQSREFSESAGGEYNIRYLSCNSQVLLMFKLVRNEDHFALNRSFIWASEHFARELYNVLRLDKFSQYSFWPCWVYIKDLKLLRFLVYFFSKNITEVF